MQEFIVMAVKRRLDSGAWEVTIPRGPGRKPLRKSSSKWTHADAVFFEQRQLQVANEQKPLLEDALDKWLEDYVPFLKQPDNLRNKAKYIRPFLQGKTFEDVSAAVLEMRKAWLKLSPTTINRRLMVLRRICHLAHAKWEWIDKPVHKKVELIHGENQRHYYLTRAEVEKLRMNCTIQEAGDLIVLAAYTGLRWSEMWQVTKRDVFNGALRLSARTKNGKPRSIPLHPKALAIAERMPLDITYTTLRKQWEQSRKLSGLGHFRWHDLRHTFASWLVQQGTQLQVVKELMGHSTIAVTMRYAHLCVDNLKEAVNRL